MKTALEIRPFEPSDITVVLELWKNCGLVVPWNNPAKDIQRKMQVNPELFLVGEVEGSVVATLMGGYEGHRGWINYLAVAEGYRNRHLARQLMNVIEQKLLALGCPKINLQVRSSNPGIIKFYEHLGYVKDGSISLGKRLIPDD